MKKKIVISIILIIFIFFVSSICKSNAEATYSQFKEIQHILNIDTDLNDSVFDKNGIQICGWRLATEKNKIIVKIDGEKIDSNYIEYSYKYDLISIVKGYGTYEENPTPMFDIKIPTKDITNGKHNIKIQLKLKDETILDTVEANIMVNKSVKNVLNIDTNLENAKFDKTGILYFSFKGMTF